MTEIRTAVVRTCVEDYSTMCTFLGEILDLENFLLGYLEYEAWIVARKECDRTVPLAS